MLEVGESHGPERHNEGHDRWLVMQSAFAEYRRASEAFDCTAQFADDSTTGERLRLITLEHQQRVAFERYLEARMEFLEFHVDGNKPPGTGAVAPPEHDAKNSGVSSSSVFASSMPVLQILTVVLLCTTLFFVIHEQKQRRDLLSNRNESTARLKQIRDGVQLYAQKFDNQIRPHDPATERVGRTPTTPVLRKPAIVPWATRRKPSAPGQRIHQPALLVQPKQAAAKGGLVPETQSRRIGRDNYYNFSIARFRQFQRVGPIKVSLWSVDSQRRYVRLSIQSNSMQIDVTRLRLKQPVWINVGNNEKPLELVVDRLAGNRLDGHLVEPRDNKAELRASQLTSILPVSP